MGKIIARGHGLLQQEQLLTKIDALKMAHISIATFTTAINNGIIKPQLVKGRTRAMFLESQVLRIEKKKKMVVEVFTGLLPYSQLKPPPCWLKPYFINRSMN